MIIRNKFKYALLIFAAVASMANAEDVAINISGKITDSPCTVDASGGSNPSINLGDNIQSTTLAANGQSSWVVFNIKLLDCPKSKTNIIATFTGTPNNADPTFLYTNTGDAKNVAIELAENGGDFKGLGNNQTLTAAIAADYTAKFNLKTRVRATGAPTGGTVSTIVFATFTYN